MNNGHVKMQNAFDNKFKSSKVNIICVAFRYVHHILSLWSNITRLHKFLVAQERCCSSEGFFSMPVERGSRSLEVPL